MLAINIIKCLFQEMIVLLVWSAVLISVLVIYFRQIYSRFSKYGVRYETPLPLLGNAARILLRLDHVANDLVKLYNKFPDAR